MHFIQKLLTIKKFTREERKKTELNLLNNEHITQKKKVKF